MPNIVKGFAVYVMARGSLIQCVMVVSTSEVHRRETCTVCRSRTYSYLVAQQKNC